MQMRRPIAALMTAVALFGGGVTLTGCGDPAGLDRNDGTSDDDAENTSGNDPSDESHDNLPDNSNEDSGNPEDSDDDSQDPQ